MKVKRNFSRTRCWAGSGWPWAQTGCVKTNEVSQVFRLRIKPERFSMLSPPFRLQLANKIRLLSKHWECHPQALHNQSQLPLFALCVWCSLSRGPRRTAPRRAAPPGRLQGCANVFVGGPRTEKWKGVKGWWKFFQLFALKSVKKAILHCIVSFISATFCERS